MKEEPTYRIITVKDITPNRLRESPFPDNLIAAVHGRLASKRGIDYIVVYNNVPQGEPRLLLESKGNSKPLDFNEVEQVIANSTLPGSSFRGGQGLLNRYTSELFLQGQYSLKLIADSFERYSPNFREAELTRLFTKCVPKFMGDKAKLMWNGSVSLD